MAITIRSEAFENGKAIPQHYSQDGRNVSPPLRFDGVPKEARELALIVDDPDAPRKDPYVHWVIYRIPGGAEGLPEAVDTGANPSRTAGARQGRNSAGHTGYDGPAPPPGHGTHHYHFHLYALDHELEIGDEPDKAALLDAMSGHVIGEGEITGTYER